MKANIVATLKDLEYGKKYRERRYCLNSEWQWGLSDDGQLYCRDDSPNAIFTGEWFLAELLQLNIDFEVVNRLSRWQNSLALKNKISASQDKDAMGTTAL